ncbi:cofactor assembly of complex C subunit B [Oscillatoria sp. FACHB-1407]|uniref:cofactor assembly of complex C subunit B n=1 Tax=Oscillatoria sp. FACHB-1407 TaxID=2692847 RepID=UPI001686D89A|nr:cofactor assembly of complex C subunit B [Oscillatoria sp. FACHB-1407]MBD2462824.1 cofactor assembly of complex C subunit B [Oscillatoria sp. FACHB-1407]
MVTPVLSSTALLTVLLAIGLMFFIRASTKDRIQVSKLVSDQPETSLLEQLERYFKERAYRIAAVDAAQNQITFEGLVRPSVFLAIFLTVLAAIGILCLSLVLSFLVPGGGNWFLLLVLLAPAAGVFYWKKSARPEQVRLQVETIQNLSPTGAMQSASQRLITVIGHRDELAELEQSLKLQPLDE